MRRILIAALILVTSACGSQVDMDPSGVDGRCIRTKEKTFLGLVYSTSEHYVDCDTEL